MVNLWKNNGKKLVKRLILDIYSLFMDKHGKKLGDSGQKWRIITITITRRMLVNLWENNGKNWFMMVDNGMIMFYDGQWWIMIMINDG